jgi:hypothetical protein
MPGAITDIGPAKAVRLNERYAVMIKMKSLAVFVVAGGCALMAAAPAHAVSAKVREACGADYKRFCPKYAPESTKARQCMRTVGKRLSVGCIDALVDAGEIRRPRR